MALTAVLAGGAARGEATELSASVPFGFRVGARSFPPGDYRVIKNQGFVILRGVDDGAFAMTQARESHGQPACLVFAKHGDDYALVQVWSRESRGEQLVRPRGEYATQSSRSQATRVVVPAL
jgi:hypothetical protein